MKHQQYTTMKHLQFERWHNFHVLNVFKFIIHHYYTWNHLPHLEVQRFEAPKVAPCIASFRTRGRGLRYGVLTIGNCRKLWAYKTYWWNCRISIYIYISLCHNVQANAGRSDTQVSQSPPKHLFLHDCWMYALFSYVFIEKVETFAPWASKNFQIDQWNDQWNN